MNHEPFVPITVGKGKEGTGSSISDEFNLSNPNDGDLLAYDLASDKWKPKPPGGGSSESVIYLLELTRWGIKNNGTSEVATTNGINNAMAWANQNGYSEMVFPLGTYLIDGGISLSPPSNLTVNLNGATLQVKTNNLAQYSVFKLNQNQTYTRITNGKLIGERSTHSYVANDDLGYGIQLGTFSEIPAGGGNNLRFICIDNLDVSEFTGDALSVNSAFNQILPAPSTLAPAWEQGDINTTDGTLVTSTSKVRSTITIDMTQSLVTQFGYFGLYGDGFGALGSGITCDFYSVYFYKADNTFISAKTLVQFFDEVEVPVGAGYAKVVLQQSTVPTSGNCKINVRVPTFPKYVYIEKNNFHHNRRQGLSVCGGKNIYIRDNDIHHIGGPTLQTGVDPMSGIDVEDGYQLNQFIHIHMNNFHDNEKYNIITVNGKGVYITNNTLLKTNNIGYVGLASNAGVNKGLISNNTIRHCKVSLMGEVEFINNHVYGTQVNVNPNYANKMQNVADNIFQNSKVVVDSAFPYIVTLDNNRFINDADKLNSLSNITQYTIQLDHQPQIFTNNVFEGQDIVSLVYTSSTNFVSGWVFRNCRFKNTKTPPVVTGIYDGCIFTDINNAVGVITQTGGNDTLEIRNCKFYIQDSNNTIFTFNSLKHLIVADSYFEKTSGWMMNIGTVSGTTLLRGNTIVILADALPRSMITLSASYNGSMMMIEDNKISATNSTRVGIDNLTTNTNTIILRGNVLTKASINKTGKEVMLNNIQDGVVSVSLTGTAPPSSTPQFVGQIFIDTTNKLSYMAVGTASSADWKQISN